MSTAKQVLVIIDKYITDNPKQQKTKEVLQKIKADIKNLVDEKFERSVNKDISYICVICGKPSVLLKQNKYCRECFDTYID